MAIYHKTTVRRAISAVDLRDCEGLPVVKDENGQLKLATGPHPLGVVHVGGNVGEFTDYILPGFSGIIGVRLDESSYPVKEGDFLECYAAGFKKVLNSSANITAIAAEDGEPGALIEAVLTPPFRFSSGVGNDVSPAALNIDAAEPVAVATAKTTAKKTTK